MAGYHQHQVSDHSEQWAALRLRQGDSAIIADLHRQLQQRHCA